VAPGASQIESQLPAYYVPGVPLPVALAVTPEAMVTVHAVEDGVPPGWTVANVSGSGAFDARNAKVKWGPFFDALPRTLSYQATPPGSQAGTVPERGELRRRLASEIERGSGLTRALDFEPDSAPARGRLRHRQHQRTELNQRLVRLAPEAEEGRERGLAVRGVDQEIEPARSLVSTASCSLICST
jgi:hypothetical protein